MKQTKSKGTSSLSETKPDAKPRKPQFRSLLQEEMATPLALFKGHVQTRQQLVPRPNPRKVSIVAQSRGLQVETSNAGPVVLITGCSHGGIGHALAREFAENGCRVVATSRSRSKMTDLEQDPRLFVQELDVRSEQSVNEVLSNVIDKFGQIDVLVNNAGIQCVGPLAEIPISAMENTFDTNVFGKIKCGFDFDSQAGSEYRPAKHWRSLQKLELQPFGIDVIDVVPGGIRSNLANSAVAVFKKWPELKLYKPYEEAIIERAFFFQRRKPTPTETFAKDTVAAVLKKNPPAWFSSGRYSTFMAIMYHMPIWYKDFLQKKSLMKKA
ncbi:hypothetical protein Bca4012_047635 [Brassica carinata]